MADDTNQNPPAGGDETPKEEAKAEEPKAEAATKEEKPVEEKKEKTASVKLDKKLQELAEKIEGLTVAEAASLAKALQEKLGISPMAAAPAAAGTAPTAGGNDTPSEEQTTFNVILANSGANKISVIKALREINPQLGLKEAKDIADAPPKEILTGVNKATATEAKDKLTAAGGQVELK